LSAIERLSLVYAAEALRDQAAAQYLAQSQRKLFQSNARPVHRRKLKERQFTT